MAAKVGQITVDFQCNTAKLQTDMQKAGASIKGLGAANASVSDSFASLGKNITNFINNPLTTAQSTITSFLGKIGPVGVAIGGIATAAVAAGGALFSFAASAAENAEKLQNLSAQTGMSTQQLQALAQIAKEAGLESLDLGRTIGMLNAQLGEGKGDFIDALNKMNISLTDLVTGKPKDAITLLDEIRVKLLAIKDPALRAQEAQDALGGRLRELIPLLVNSKASMHDMIREMEASGVVYDEITKEKLAALDEALDSAGRKFTALKIGAEAWVGGMIASFSTWDKAKDLIAHFADNMSKGLNAGQAFALATQQAGSAVDKQAQATANLNKEATEALPTFTKINFSEQTLAELAKWAADDLKKQKQEMEALAKQTQNAIAPMDALAEKLDKQMKLGFSKDQLIKVYSDEIIKATKSQAEFGKPLTDNERELAGLALQFKFATDKAGLFKDISDDLTKQMERLGESFPSNELIDYGRHIDELRKKSQEALPPLEDLTQGDKYLKEIMEEGERVFGKYNKAQEEAKEKAEALGKSLSRDLGGAVENLSSALADNLIDWTNWKDTIINFGKDIADSLLTAFLDGFLSPLKSALTSFGKGFGNWLTGLFSGGGGGGFNPIGWLTSGISGGNGGLIGSLLGIGGSAAGVGSAAAAGSIATAGALGGGMIGGTAAAEFVGPIAASSIAGGGAAGAGAAAGGSSFMGSMGAFFTNPWTIGIGAAAGLGYIGYKLAQGPNSYEALDDEVTRDLGVNVNDKQMKSFMDAMGIKEEQAWSHRMEIEQSPQFMAYLLSLGLRPHTKVEAFKSPLAWGAVRNQWGPYDDVWSNWAFNEIGLPKSPWGSLTIPNGAYPENESDIPAYHSGIDFVPRDMIAYLQRGERVVPATENRTSIRNGDIIFNLYGVGENIVEVVKTKVIPIIKREMIGGNSGLREAVRSSIATTARAY